MNYTIQQNSIQNYFTSDNSKNKFSNHLEYNTSNHFQIKSQELIEINGLESKSKCESYQLNILKQIYDNDEQSSITLKKCKKANQKIENQENSEIEQREMNKQDSNEFREYEKVELFNNDFTKVTYQYNEQIKQLTIKKYFKQTNKSEFLNEIKILKLFADHKITLPFVSYSDNNELWYEQISGQKDFLILRNQYSSVKNMMFDNKKKEYVHNLKILFCKLYQKLDKMFELGYAHSDIKPQNIVLGYDGQPYFIDFGASVQLHDFKNYLNQFTHLYNHSRYFHKKKGYHSYKKYIFQNVDEIKLCDRIQLTISFLYLILKRFEVIWNKNKEIEQIDLFQLYFQQKDFNQIILFFTSLKDEEFDEVKQKYQTKSKFDKTIHYLRKGIDDNLIDILNLINLGPDHYEKIKDKIYEISYLNINSSIFSDFEGPNVLKTINQYNINFLNVYLNKQNHLVIYLNGFIEKLEQNNKIFVKKEFNAAQISYKIYINYDNEYKIEKNDLLKIKCIQDFKNSYEKDNSIKNINRIHDQFTDIFNEILKNNFLVKKIFLIKQNKIQKCIIDHVINYLNIVSNHFQTNKYIITIYEVIFIDDDFFNQIYSLSNQTNEFKLVFINCKFNQNLLIKIASFIKKYQKYNILYSQNSNSQIKKSQVSYQSIIDYKISENTQQKTYIQLQFIDTEYNHDTKYKRDTEYKRQQKYQQYLAQKQNQLFKSVQQLEQFQQSEYKQQQQQIYIFNDQIQKQEQLIDSSQTKETYINNNINSISKFIYYLSEQQQQKQQQKQSDNNFQSLFKTNKHQNTLSNQIPIYAILNSQKNRYFQEALEEYSKNNDQFKYINFFINNYINQQNKDIDTLIINENDFFNYFFSDEQKDKGIEMQKIINNFVILSLYGVQYLISHSFFYHILLFLNLQDNNLERNKKVLVLTILQQNSQQQQYFDEQNSEKSKQQQNKMKQLINLIPFILIEKYQNEHSNSLVHILQIIEKLFQLCQNLNIIVDALVKLNQSNSNKPLSISDYKITQKEKLKQIITQFLIVHSNDLSQQFNYSQYSDFQIDFYLQQFERRFDPKHLGYLFEDIFEKDLNNLQNLEEKHFLRYQQPQLINGMILIDQLKQKLIVQNDEAYDFTNDSDLFF